MGATFHQEFSQGALKGLGPKLEPLGTFKKPGILIWELRNKNWV